MTLPMRGIWKNGVLVNVLTQHGQVMQKNTGSKIFVLPVGLPMPPNRVQWNAHSPSTIPGLRASQHPGLRKPTATPKSDEQTKKTRQQTRFIPGTASATANQVKANAKGV